MKKMYIISLLAFVVLISGCSPPPLTPEQQKAFLENISGSYSLISFNESQVYYAEPQPLLYGEPIAVRVPTLTDILGFDVNKGTLNINGNGDAIWELVFQWGDNVVTPLAGIKCSGKVNSSLQKLVGISGFDNEAINWPKDFITRNDTIWLEFCGWNALGDSAPFALYIDVSEGKKILRMENSYGTFIWSS